MFALYGGSADGCRDYAVFFAQVDETIRRKSVLLNGCSIYAVHFSQQELFDRKLYPVSIRPEDRSDEWGEVAEGGYHASSAEGKRRRKEELLRMSELEAKKQARAEKDEM